MDTGEGTLINTLLNQDPLFIDNQQHDFRLGEGSPAIGAGNPAVAADVPLDLFGQDRTGKA